VLITASYGASWLRAVLGLKFIAVLAIKKAPLPSSLSHRNIVVCAVRSQLEGQLCSEGFAPTAFAFCSIVFSSIQGSDVELRCNECRAVVGVVRIKILRDLVSMIPG
jgi:hypothetical protein